ncbi:Diacylglycerol kinase family protein isoform 1 [Tripterygium wilfordii]|uniref:Diacylglycerol kinase family protein isoform 1 n=1 Tax=Tripterygium wilfordii TaxID=458696 RepID=A0A7J7CA77_TRIWF|nr:ceramide kinase isoform X2 [Tripterygium wilfordii]KAF5731048.1 Diacylglycerol kinase family protein isoform 1 [Tripterygium wilfordii]
MEKTGDAGGIADEFFPNAQADVGPLVSSTNLFLDKVGEVVLTCHSDGLSWKLLEPPDDDRTCLGLKQISRTATEVKFSDVYAVELMHGSGRVNGAKCFSLHDCHDSKMYHFSVHSFERSKSQPSLLTLVMYAFSHNNMETCQMWVNRINDSLNKDIGRPKNLLVFVNPFSGKANGFKTWETVAPIFSRAKVKTKVIATERAGHAFDVMASMAVKDLKSYDGVLAVGGDGFFNEILNGFLLSRHNAPNLPTPSDFFQPVGTNSVVNVTNDAPAEASHQDEDQSPFLSGSRSHNGSGLMNLNLSKFTGSDPGLSNPDQDHAFPIPSERFRFGIIPAGSTDSIVMCTTGARDTITSSLHIVLGKRVCLDIARVVRWKTTSTSTIEPFVRYAASFAGYGFYGDVITESEKYRFMGPKRYDYAGTKVFLRHRSYEAEVAYLEVESEKTKLLPENGRPLERIRAFLGQNKSDNLVCRKNCKVCNTKPNGATTRTPNAMPYSHPKGARWLKSRGNFLSVGAAIISNRNEKAPDGLVADAHLSDGFLHLILIRNCPRALYLWHLTQLARRGGEPLNFEFVEHHKTPAFAFTSFGNESVWNLDGELFQAHQLSAQVFRGLISYFASGPEV